LAGSSGFIQYDFITTDTASHLLKALQLYQELMQLHKTDADPAAFIDINIERIQWAYNKTTLDNKEILYKNALLDITNTFANNKTGC
jgi:hypothetical protein